MNRIIYPTIAMIGSKGIPAHSGGVERHVEELAVRLAKQRARVIVYTRPWYGATGALYVYKYKRVQLRPLRSLSTKHLDAITHTFASSIDALIRGVDIIHLHGIGPALVAPFIRLVSFRRVIVTLHCQDYYHQKWGILAKIALRLGEWCAVRWSHELIVVSKELQRHVWATYHRSATYIPNGARSLSGRASSVNKTLKEMRLRKNGYILSVGRLIPHKGVHILIQAYRLLSPHLPLVIVGGGSYTDRYIRELKALAKGRPSIRFLGERGGAQLEALYRGARVVVQPSGSEGMSIALLEAMAFAKPVIVSDIPENQEVMINEKYYFRRSDAGDCARALGWVLAHPREGRAQGRENRARAISLYDWNQISIYTRELYDRALDPPRFFSTRLVPLSFR